MIAGFFKIPWFGWAALAFIIAVVYSIIWPHKVMTTSRVRFFILRRGHALTWILLSLNFVLRGISPSLNGAATLIALAGGVMYMLFIAMTYVVKK